MKTNKKKLKSVFIGSVTFLVVFDFVLLIIYFLRGRNIAILNPKGLVAQQQLDLFIFTTAILFTIGIPTLLILYFTAWKYRATNNATTYDARSSASKPVVFSMWAIPSVFAIVLATVMWSATHKLVPQEAIAHEKEPMTIQVVSMNWKWLFIYPEQKIATVNFVQIPVDTPITFELTADESPMSSFWIPNLGGQLYSMTTHVNRLNLIAETPGDYPGNSAEINGEGFAGMKFTARASSRANFDRWVEEVRLSDDLLSMANYNDLLKPSENHPVTLYSSFEENLFAKVIQKYYAPIGADEHN